MNSSIAALHSFTHSTTPGLTNYMQYKVHSEQRYPEAALDTSVVAMVHKTASKYFEILTFL